MVCVTTRPSEIAYFLEILLACRLPKFSHILYMYIYDRLYLHTNIYIYVINSARRGMFVIYVQTPATGTLPIVYIIIIRV